MPISPEPSTSRALSRRTLLVGGVLATTTTLAACTTGAPSVPAVTSAPPDPLADLVIAHESLLAQYDAAITALASEARLPGLRDNVTAHLAALTAAIGQPPAASTSARASDSASASTSPAATPPADPASIVPALRASEKSLGTQCRDAAIEADADRAPLLASIAAAHNAATGLLS